MGKLIPLILAGGSGSRLWPLSRELYPKQFHALLGGDTMLQATVNRAAKVATADPIVVCNEEHRFLVAEQLRAIDRDWLCLMLEPQGRNTAPAVALGAHRALAEDPDALLLFLPSDHLIKDESALAAAVASAADSAASGRFVMFGVTPSRPETGYGYIEARDVDAGVQPIVSFKEKPDVQSAAAYVADGKHLWNSGMFVLHAQAYLDELARLQPEMAACVQAAFEAGKPDLDFFRPGSGFVDCAAESIDRAVMEHTEKALVVPVDLGWNDIGSWSAIWDESPLDEDGNHFSARRDRGGDQRLAGAREKPFGRCPGGGGIGRRRDVGCSFSCPQRASTGSQKTGRAAASRRPRRVRRAQRGFPTLG